MCFVDDFGLYTRALGEDTMMTTTSADPHASQEDIVIEVLKDFPDNVAAFACRGHLTKADYETVLIPVIEDKLKRHKKLRAYTEIAPDFPPGSNPAPSGRKRSSDSATSSTGNAAP